MNYKTYAEAKIAHPDSEIVTTGKSFCFNKALVGIFQARLNQSTEYAGWHCISDDAWVICNPADYCSTLKEFLWAGFKLAKGDIILDVDEELFIISTNLTSFNEADTQDETRYILSSSALNGDCKIPAKSEQWTVYNNTMPLCELTDEQCGKMRRMHDAGMSVEWRRSAIVGWELLTEPSWNTDDVYRIKTKSERELFIDKSVGLMTSETERTMEQMFGSQFDAGARYKDAAQHFGENI